MTCKKKTIIAILAVAAIPVLSVVVVFLIGFCRGIAAQFPNSPRFFGVKIGEEYRPDYSPDDSGAVSSYLFWIRDKYIRNDRPYAFAGVRLEKNVEAKIHKIDEFYEQDMSLLLVTKNTKKVIGIVVAAKCKTNAIDNVVREISTTICSKHKNTMVFNKLEPWQNAAMLRFARRPSLDRIAVPTVSERMVCVDENFEATVMGVRFKTVDEPSRNPLAKTESDGDVLSRVSNAESARYACDDAPVADSDYLREARINHLVKWQIEPQTIEEMFEERKLNESAVKYDFDPEAAFVYVLVMAHKYDKEIAIDENEFRMNELRKRQQMDSEQNRVREKNAAAL